MQQVSKFQLAAIKRAYQNNKSLYTKIQKLEEKKLKIDEEIKVLQEQTELWEAPVKAITNGLTSKEYLDSLNEEEVTTEEVAQDSENDSEERMSVQGYDL